MTNDVKEVLAKILIHDIYRFDSNLVRNDSKTAQLVKSFSKHKADDYFAAVNRSAKLGGRIDRQTTFEFEEKHGRLYNLSEETLRKYIRELWQNQVFSNYLRFELDQE